MSAMFRAIREENERLRSELSQEREKVGHLERLVVEIKRSGRKVFPELYVDLHLIQPTDISRIRSRWKTLALSGWRFSNLSGFSSLRMINAIASCKHIRDKGFYSDTSVLWWKRFLPTEVLEPIKQTPVSWKCLPHEYFAHIRDLLACSSGDPFCYNRPPPTRSHFRLSI